MYVIHIVKTVYHFHLFHWQKPHLSKAVVLNQHHHLLRPLLILEKRIFLIEFIIHIFKIFVIYLCHKFLLCICYIFPTIQIELFVQKKIRPIMCFFYVVWDGGGEVAFLTFLLDIFIALVRILTYLSYWVFIEKKWV